MSATERRDVPLSEFVPVPEGKAREWVVPGVLVMQVLGDRTTLGTVGRVSADNCCVNTEGFWTIGHLRQRGQWFVHPDDVPGDPDPDAEIIEQMARGRWPITYASNPKYARRLGREQLDAMRAAGLSITLAEAGGDND